jgi:hypothetical protein
MRYSLVIVTIIVIQSCTLFKHQKNQEKVNLEFIQGQWIDTESLNRLKQGNLSEPYPFGWEASQEDIFTCFKDGKPYFKDLMNDYGFLEKKEGYFQWTSTDNNVKIKLNFNVKKTDTLMIFEYQYKSNEPFIYSLSKIQRGGECVFDYYPGKEVRSGASICYNQYYFEGKYTVKEMYSNQESTVEINSDNIVSGLARVSNYSIYSKCTPILVTLYELDTLHNQPIRVDDKIYPRIIRRYKQHLALNPEENGFDLFRTDYSNNYSLAERRHKVYEKVYEFRRLD